METNSFNHTMSNDAPINDNGLSPQPMMSFKQAVSTCLANYADFSGRARRSEYWWFSLFIFLVVLVLMAPVAVMAYLEESGGVNMDAGGWPVAFLITSIMALIGALFVLGMLIPSLAVQVRRLHDTGRSGWWVVWNIVLSLLAAFVPMFAYGFGQAMDMDSIDTITRIGEVALLPGILVVVTQLGEWILEIILLVFSLLDSDKGENQYGPSPKYQ